MISRVSSLDFVFWFYYDIYLISTQLNLQNRSFLGDRFFIVHFIVSIRKDERASKSDVCKRLTFGSAKRLWVSIGSLLLDPGLG